MLGLGAAAAAAAAAETKHSIEPCAVDVSLCRCAMTKYAPLILDPLIFSPCKLYYCSEVNVKTLEDPRYPKGMVPHSSPQLQEIFVPEGVIRSTFLLPGMHALEQMVNFVET